MATPKRRGTVTSLALLLSLGAYADDSLRGVNYVLIHDQQHPLNSRLLIFSDSSGYSVEGFPSRIETAEEIDVALSMTRHLDSRVRVRGLTLLSGVDDRAALDAAMELLLDNDPAVREEAIQLVMEHPDSDLELAASIGTGDPSARVRQATSDLLADLAGD